MLVRITDNTSCYNLDNGNMLRDITMKIGLKRIDTQKKVIVEALLNKRATELVMSSEFARKQGFKFEKIKNPIYIRNVNGTFNKERPI